MSKNFILLFLILILPVLPAYTVEAVAVSPGTILDPPGPTKYVWDCVYEDDRSLICKESITGRGIRVGGIYCLFEPTVELTIIVHGWYPENKDVKGATVFDLSAISQQAGSFIASFEGLAPNTKYVIYKNDEKWKTVTSDKDGKLTFSDGISSEKRYVIKCAKSAPALPVPPPTTPKPVPGFEVVLAILGFSVAYLLKTAR